MWSSLSEAPSSLPFFPPLLNPWVSPVHPFGVLGDCSETVGRQCQGIKGKNKPDSMLDLFLFL